MIDRHTRWIEAIPIPNMEASTCADAFIAGWVSRFGVPATVTSDRGRQFTSAIWEVLCRRLGIHHVTTTAYHPQSNGMIERAHRQIKDALRSRAAGDKWPAHLPWILLGLRAAPKDDSNTSSAELVFGCRITVPGQFLDSPEPPAISFLEALQDVQPIPTRQRSYAEVAAALPPELLAAKFVYTKGGSVPPLSPPYEGPFSVVEAGPKFFTVDIGGRRETVSVDRLKPYMGPPLRPRRFPRDVDAPLAPRGQSRPCLRRQRASTWGGALWRPQRAK
jgi:hypothetical protein